MPAQPYNQFRKFIELARWLSKSKSIDSIDSPFLTEFYHEIIHRKIEDPKVIQIETIRNQYLKNISEVTLTDYGAGSSKERKDSVSVRHIASTAVSDKRKCKLLYNICRYFKPHSMLELGTSLGISTLYLKAGWPDSAITTIDADHALTKIFKEHLPTWARDVNIVSSTFSNAIPALSPQINYDLIFIDGGHTSDNVLQLLEELQPRMKPGTVMIIDDIYWSKDMTDGWKTIKSESQCNVAIDLWYFGLLWHDERIKESIDIKIAPLDKRWQIGLFR